MDAPGRNTINPAERAEIDQVLTAWDPAIVVTSVQRFSGLTNQIFEVATPDATVAVRLPGLGTNAYIGRRAELHNARLMSKLGIGATILHAADGALVRTSLGSW